jgi:6,7-dimethyl-8-ribityllumazine synthase
MILVVQSLWNEAITDKIVEAAIQVLKQKNETPLKTLLVLLVIIIIIIINPCRTP